MNGDEYNKLIKDLNNDPLFEEVEKMISKRSFFITADYRARQSAAQVEAQNRPEVREKKSAAMKEYWSRRQN